METVAVGKPEKEVELEVCKKTCIYDAEGNCIAEVHKLC